MTESCDTVLNVCNSFGYDEFNRLTARTVNQGTAQNFTYTFDRYGNRWAQNAPQGGPTLNISFNKANNIINVAGFYNDLVGNVTGDTFHSYFYDADGNLTSVDNGQTAKYYYDSLNQRVQIAPARGTYEFVWDIFGRRVSNWSAASHSFVESNAYTDSSPIAIRSAGGTQFEHQNWLGTERVRTSYNGAVVLSIASLPWADQHTPAGDNGDQHDFAGTDRDLETNSEHARFRQFSTNLGRWLSPDQYLGSYDINNPQSFNRYSYALNNPANFLDPSGLTITCMDGHCIDDEGLNNTDCNGSFAVCVTSGSDCVAYGTEGCITASNPGTPAPIVPSNGGASGSSGTASNAPNSGLKQKICSALPTGRTIGVSGGLGGVGSVGGGGEVVINYQSGQVSAFGFGGVQVGWNGGASGSAYTGFVYGLNGSNSNYSGGFTGVNGGAGFGGFAARSSGGLTGGAGGLLPTSGVTAAGVSFGGGLLSGVSGGVSATNYSNPFQFGSRLSALIRNLSPVDSLLYAAQQVCK